MKTAAIPEKDFSFIKIICAIAVFSHLITLYLYYLNQASLPLGFRFSWHFYSLLTISATISLGLFFSRDNRVIFILLLLRYLIFYLIGYPLGSDIGIELILFSGLIMETVFYPRGRLSFFLLPLFILFFILTQGPGSAWEQSISGVSLPHTITAGTLSVLIGLLSLFLKKISGESLLRSKKIEHLNSAISQLTDANIGFQSYVKTQEFKIIMEERKRVSRDIHDTVGYALTNIIMMMEEVQLLSDSHKEKRVSTIIRAKEQAKKGLVETRAALRHLRRERVSQTYGINMVEELVSAFRQASGIDILVEYGNLPDFIDIRIDQVIFRIIQEGLTNAFRHGMATKIRISFWVTGSRIKVTIHDNGIGAKEIVEGIGVAGMRERMEALKGDLVIRNVDDGFKIEAFIPVEVESNG